MAKKARNGAFELSITFIIIIIFAVVLLTLGITWLRGIVGGISGITDDLTQDASTKLQETFRQSSQNFAIWPPRWEMTAGKILKMSAGLKNNVADSASHTFVINVVPTAISSQVAVSFGSGCSSSNFRNCQVGTDKWSNTGGQPATLENFMKSWVTFNQGVFGVESGATNLQLITVTVPSTVPQGTYMFGVVACRTDAGGPTSSDACTAQAANYGGSMQSLEIVITA